MSTEKNLKMKILDLNTFFGQILVELITIWYTTVCKLICMNIFSDKLLTFKENYEVNRAKQEQFFGGKWLQVLSGKM